MDEFRELRVLLDTMSARVKESWRKGSTEWKVAVADLLRCYAKAVARALLELSPQGEEHFVLVWPGINLRLGQRHLTRYFLASPAPFNTLPIRSGALIYCSKCDDSAISPCAEKHLRATAPLYAFDHLLSDDRNLKLRGNESAADLPALGTHPWLLSEPQFRHGCNDSDETPTNLWVLRVTKETPQGQGLLDTKFHREGILSVHVGSERSGGGGGVNYDFGMRLGSALDSLIDTKVPWPSRPGQQRTENIHLHRRIYDLWLTSVFAPSDLYDQLTRVANLFDVPPALLRAALQLQDGLPYQEWISWRLAPTIPLLDDSSPEDKELGPELGSLMVLTTFSMPPDLPLGSLADRLRHNTEHAYLKLRTGDDAQIAVRWATAVAVAPFAHELRKWSDSLQWLFGHSSRNPEWVELASRTWSSTGFHREFAALFSEALFFSTTPLDNHLGLFTISIERQVVSTIHDSFKAACALFNLAVARVAGSKISADIPTVARTFEHLQKKASDVRVHSIGHEQFLRWLDYSVDTEQLAFLSHVLVTHFLNFLKHGQWGSGVDIELARAPGGEALEIIGTNLAGRDDQWIDVPDLESVLISMKSIVADARTERMSKLASSMQTLATLERQSIGRVRSLRAEEGPGGRWRWGISVEINPGAAKQLR